MGTFDAGFRITCPNCRFDLAMLELGGHRCSMCGTVTPIENNLSLTQK